MTMRAAAIWMGVAMWAGPVYAAKPPASLDEARAEANPEKRSVLALDFARAAVGRVVSAFEREEDDEARELLESIVEAAALAESSLDETGKHARAKPKYFKNAEIETRKLARDLENSKRKLTYEERDALDPAIARIEEINRRLLLAIMESRK